MNIAVLLTLKQYLKLDIGINLQQNRGNAGNPVNKDQVLTKIKTIDKAKWSNPIK